MIDTFVDVSDIINSHSRLNRAIAKKVNSTKYMSGSFIVLDYFFQKRNDTFQDFVERFLRVKNYMLIL